MSYGVFGAEFLKKKKDLDCACVERAFRYLCLCLLFLRLQIRPRIPTQLTSKFVPKLGQIVIFIVLCILRIGSHNLITQINSDLIVLHEFKLQ